MKESYIGVNNQPKKIKDMYIGVNGVPKKVLEAYIGDKNEVPKLWWKSSETYVIFSNGVLNGRFVHTRDYPTGTTFTNDGVGAVAISSTSNNLYWNHGGDGVWRNSYLKTGIEVKAGNTLEFNDSRKVTASKTGELILCFDLWSRGSVSFDLVYGGLGSILILASNETLPSTVKFNHNPYLPTVYGVATSDSSIPLPLPTYSFISVEIS